MNYARAIRELESFGVMPERAPSLEPMRRALGLAGLGDCADPRRVAVVAGTNGKGSVSAMLGALLESAGRRTGVYTSPHLVETTERFRVGGRDLSPEELTRAYESVRDVALELRLSHFEVLTLMAARVFFDPRFGRPVEYAVLEVGLGGLWDATNAIPHDFCVITALGLDHQNLLGSTLPEIAANKFGIVGEGAVVVHAPLPPEAREAARLTQARTASRWREAPAPALGVTAAAEPRFEALTRWGRAPLSLPGARGARNAGVALQAFEELGFDPAAHLSALAQVRWPGRMERIAVAGAPCPVYLSGDHNPQGVASLLELLPAYRRRQLHCVVGVGKDKDLDGVLGPLFGIPDALVHLTETPFRGRLLEHYGPWLARAASAHADPARALQHALGAAQADDLVLVTGSLYLVGWVRGHTAL